LKDLTGTFGWSFASHNTAQPADAALLSLYGALSKTAVWE